MLVVVYASEGEEMLQEVKVEWGEAGGAVS